MRIVSTFPCRCCASSVTVTQTDSTDNPCGTCAHCGTFVALYFSMADGAWHDTMERSRKVGGCAS